MTAPAIARGLKYEIFVDTTEKMKVLTARVPARGKDRKPLERGSSSLTT